jgi:LytS/YehU family sensor histidine kinase
MNPNFRITCTGFDDVTGLFITPFLLLPLIENCFKHVSQWPDRDNEIRITCSQQKNTFLLHTCNSIQNGHEPATAGIGLKNIQKQLALVYPGLHQLAIQQTGERFELTLQIDLS